MCRFFESIQLNNGMFKRLELHQERVGKAIKDYYPAAKAFDLAESLDETTFPMAGLFKCRVLYDSVILKIEYIPYVQREINSLKLVETEIGNTHYKLEDRSLYAAAFALRGDCDDIILIKNGLLTDTSFSNIALFDGISWYTPRIPLIYGVNRAELIQQGVLIEKDLKASDLVNFKLVSLFNAVNEFGCIELDISAICQ